MKAKKLGTTLARLALGVPRLAYAVADSLADGPVTSAEDAEARAREASHALGDMLLVRIKRSGEKIDVVDDDAQADIAAAIARIAYRIVEGYPDESSDNPNTD